MRLVLVKCELRPYHDRMTDLTIDELFPFMWALDEQDPPKVASGRVALVKNVREVPEKFRVLLKNLPQTVDVDLLESFELALAEH